MKSRLFKNLLSQLSSLTSHQRHLLLSAVSDKTAFASVNIIQSHQERFEFCCPFCESFAIIRWGKSCDLQRFRCKACRKTFNALTGSSLSKLHHKDRWLCFSQCLLESKTVRASARTCGIDPSTAFRWRHRFLSEPSQDKVKPMEGIVEADETFFTESCKGSRNLQRPARKRGKSMKIHLGERIPVLMVRDRTGTEADFVFKKIEKEIVHSCLEPLMGGEVVLCSDGNSIYTTFAKKSQIPHKRILRNRNVYVVEHIFHIQNLNAYISRLKQWLINFHGVATKYLEHYLGWRRLLEKKGEELNERRILELALGRNHQQRMQT